MKLLDPNKYSREDVVFVEKTTVNLTRIINTVYRDGVDEILGIDSKDNGSIEVVFRDEDTAYKAVISKGNRLSYNELDSVKNNVRRDSSKKRQCGKGKPCGDTCVAKGYTCDRQLSPVAAKVANATRVAIEDKKKQKNWTDVAGLMLAGVLYTAYAYVLIQQIRFAVGDHGQVSPPNYKSGDAPDRRPEGSIPLEELERKIRAEEEKIRYNSYETATVIDPENGRVVFTQPGQKDTVNLTARQLAMVEGMVVTHNHPPMSQDKANPMYKGISFSEPDIRTSCIYRLAEIRACSVGYLHSMKPPDGGWNQDFFNNTVKPIYDEEVSRAYQELTLKVNLFQFSSDAANAEVNHLVWKRVAERTGMYYSREKLPDNNSSRSDAEQQARSKQVDVAPELKEMLTQLSGTLNSVYRDGVDSILRVDIDKSKVITGKFRDEDQVYNFEIQPDGSVSFIEAEAEGTRSDAYLTGWMKAVRIDTPATPAKKKRSCVQGKPCGNTCVAKGVKCRSKLSAQMAQNLPQLQDAITNLKSKQQPTPASPEKQKPSATQSSEAGREKTKPSQTGGQETGSIDRGTTEEAKQNRLAQLGFYVGAYLAVNAVDRQYQISDKIVSGAARAAFAGVNALDLDNAVKILPIGEDNVKKARELVGATKVALVRTVNEREGASIVSVDPKTNAITYKLADGSYQSVTSVGGKVLMFTTNMRGAIEDSDGEHNVYSMKFTVDNTFDRNAGSREEGLKLAKNASSIFKEHLKIVPDGSHLVCWAHKGDDAGEKRQNIYQKAGFVEVPNQEDEGEKVSAPLWAVKHNGAISSPDSKNAERFFDDWDPNFDQPIFWEKIRDIAGEAKDAVEENIQNIRKRKQDSLVKSDAVDPQKLDEVYRKYKQTVNMSASELKRWSESEESRFASLDRSPINRNLELLSTPKSNWTNKHIAWANRTISFVERMKGAEQGKPANAETKKSKRDISLMNWAYNPRRDSRSDAEGKPCGKGYISANKKCRSQSSLNTPDTGGFDKEGGGGSFKQKLVTLAAIAGVSAAAYMAAQANYRSNFDKYASEVEEKAKTVQAKKVGVRQHSIVFGVGGMAYGDKSPETISGERTVTGVKMAFSRDKGKDFKLIPIDNTGSNIAADKKEGSSAQFVADAIQNHFRNIIQRGRNEAAIDMAAQVVAWADANPDKQIVLMGSSLGGQVVYDTQEYLRRVRPDLEGRLKSVTFGTWHGGMTKPFGESIDIVGDNDPVNRVPVRNPRTVKGVEGHTQGAYFKNADVKKIVSDFIYRDVPAKEKKSDAYRMGWELDSGMLRNTALVGGRV